MSRNGKTTPFRDAFAKLPESSVQTPAERPGSRLRRYDLTPAR
jgi:hypothetical protein